MKKKIYISIFVFFIICIAIYGILYLNNKDKVPVLCYHNIATAEEKANFPEESEFVIDVKNFEEHLKYLKRNNYKTLTMDEFYDWKQGNLDIPIKSVLITFDDGFLSNYQHAFPLLKKYDMNATVFVIGEFSDDSTQMEWDGNIKTYMPYNLIEKSKKEYPNIEFCSHSYYLHHKGAIDDKTEGDFEADIGAYKINFSDTKYFAYPFGDYNHALITALQSKDFKLGFKFGPNANDFRKAEKKDDNFKIPRINVSAGMPVWKFALRCLIL